MKLVPVMSTNRPTRATRAERCVLWPASAVPGRTRARTGPWSAPWIERTEQHTAPANSRYTKWATDDSYYAQVGSIYSAQGFEFDYIGLIIGEDLIWREDRWVADVSKNKDGVFKRDLKSSGSDAAEHLRNIYRVLLTRGMKGTFVFFLDQDTRRHFEELLSGTWLPVARAGNRFLLRNGEQARVHDLDSGEMSEPQPFEVWFTFAEWEPASRLEHRLAQEQNRTP